MNWSYIIKENTCKDFHYDVHLFFCYHKNVFEFEKQFPSPFSNSPRWTQWDMKLDKIINVFLIISFSKFSTYDGWYNARMLSKLYLN